MSETAHHPDCKCFVIVLGREKLSIGCRQRLKIPTTIGTVLGIKSHDNIDRIMRSVIVEKS